MSDDSGFYLKNYRAPSLAGRKRAHPPTLPDVLSAKKRQYTMTEARRNADTLRTGDLTPLVDPRKNAEVSEKKTNTHILDFVLSVVAKANGQSVYDVDGMRALFVEYVKLAHECNMPIDNMTAYMAMGISKDTARVWKTGKHGTPEHRDLIMFVDRICAAYRQIAVNSGKINPVWGIFISKNFDGLENEHLAGSESLDVLEEAKSAESIRQKYENLPDD